WDVNESKPIRRLNTLTIGLVGFGTIPRRLAMKVQALGMNVIVCDPFVSSETAKEKNAKLVSLEELCKKSEVISVHVPLKASTRGRIGKEQCELLEKGVSFVNTARGPVVEQDELLRALEYGLVAGAGLGVIETEPFNPVHPFLIMENVTLTPHMAG